MLVFTIFVTIVMAQLFIFTFVSLPLYVVTHKVSPSTRSDEIDMPKPNKYCNVTTDCGECRMLTDNIGILQSQNFPNEYNPDLNCYFKLTAPRRMKIQLTFTDFSIKKCCDFITVFDGLANPLLVGQSGNEIPANVTSPSNQMIVKFTSSIENTLTNASTDDLGPVKWRAMYTFVL